MLENRDYMRELVGWFLAIPMVCQRNLDGRVDGIFALQCINDVYLESLVERRFALTPLALTAGHIWQFLTFQFLHVSIGHLIGNLLGLWFFGRFVEHVLGTKRFLTAYFMCGVIGGLLQCLLMVLFPRHFAPFVFGASAGVLGMFAVFCRLQADSEVRLYFVLPIRADILLWIIGGHFFVFYVGAFRTRWICSAHAAHLGGILAGLAWVRLGWHRDFVQLPWENWFRHLRSSGPRQRENELLRSAPLRKGSWRKANTVSPQSEDVPPAEFISQEVDPILDKISAHGIHSLTDQERQILDAARKKMAKR